MSNMHGALSDNLPVDDIQPLTPNFEINPDPIVLEDTDILVNDFLSPSRLQEIAGQSDLDALTMMEMVVNTTETTMGNFGTYLPNLKYLKLSNSIIPSMRDVGTSLPHLKVLWMSCCGLRNVDGVSSMTSLTELYLAYNDIEDVSPLGFIDELQVLDLEGNQISDKYQFDYLAMLSNLTTLSISGNPVCQTINNEALQNLERNSFESSIDTLTYREFIIKKLPRLKYLDDEKCESFEGTQAHSLSDRPSTASLAASSHSQEDIEVIANAIKEGLITEEETAAICFGEDHPIKKLRPIPPNNFNSRPSSARMRRPASALSRPSTASSLGRTLISPSARPMTGLPSGRSGSAGTNRSDSVLLMASNAQRPNSSGSGEVNLDDESSTLTFGDVICGNPIKALRDRKVSPLPVLNILKRNENQRPATAAPFRTNRNESQPEIGNSDDILAELRSWRLMHEERIKQQISDVQILKIDENTSSEEILLDSDATDSEPDEILNLENLTDTGDKNNNHSATESANSSPVATKVEHPLTDLRSEVPNFSVKLHGSNIKLNGNRAHSPPPKNLSPSSINSSRSSPRSPTSPIYSSSQFDSATVPVLKGSPKPKTPTSPNTLHHVPAPPPSSVPRPKTSTGVRIRRSLASSSHNPYVPLASPMVHPQRKRQTASKVNQ